MRRPVLIGVAAVFLALPAVVFASGGPGDPAFGNGKYPLESRTFSSCKRFAATIPFYRSCLDDAATALVDQDERPGERAAADRRIRPHARPAGCRRTAT